MANLLSEASLAECSSALSGMSRTRRVPPQQNPRWICSFSVGSGCVASPLLTIMPLYLTSMIVMGRVHDHRHHSDYFDWTIRL